MKSSSDRAFLLLVATALVPLGAIAFGVARAAHEVPAVLSDGPSPIIGLCRQAVVYTVAALAHVSYFGFGTLAAVSIALGALAAVSAHTRAGRRLRAATFSRNSDLPPRLRALASRAGVRRLRVIEADGPQAFTFGYLKPTVCVSRGLAARLTDDELEAVLRHEAEHVRRRDPLRVLVITAISRALVFAPLARRLADSFHVAKEIDADRAVIREMGGRRALVSALLAAALAETSAAVGFADTLLARIAWLEGEDPLAGRARGWGSVVVTVTAVLAVAGGLFIITTGTVDAHVLHVCGKRYLSG